MMTKPTWKTFARRCGLLSLGIGFLLIPLPAAKADPMAYEVMYYCSQLTNCPSTRAGYFGTVDLTTGAFTETSQLPFAEAAGLAESGSNLYTAEYSGSVFGQLNPVTGAFTPISSTGPSGTGVSCPSCLYPPAGTFEELGSTPSTIYAMDGAQNLYSIDPTTGIATLIGPTGLSPLTTFSLSNGSSVLYEAVLNVLYTINTTTGAATEIGPTTVFTTDGWGIDSLLVENGILYAGDVLGFDIPTEFYSIDPANGAATFLVDQSVGEASFGLAPIPEPNSLVMLGTGLIGLIGFFRARRGGQRPRSV